MADLTAVVTAPDVGRLIYQIRDLRVILDSDLADLYGVATKVLNQAVKRNRDKFPGDFLFHLTQEEADDLRRLRSQIVTLKTGRRAAPQLSTKLKLT